MGWKWGKAIQGALSGAQAGMQVAGPIGAAYGAAGGGALGGLGDDFDKMTSGNSQGGLAHAGLGLLDSFNGASSGGGFIRGGGFRPNDLPRGAGIQMGGQGADGVSFGGNSSSGGGFDPQRIMSEFQRFTASQGSPTDPASEAYDPMAHAGMIKSRYPFIPDDTFQRWLAVNKQQPSGYQFAGGARF